MMTITLNTDKEKRIWITAFRPNITQGFTPRSAADNADFAIEEMRKRIPEAASQKGTDQ
jgi:hypothetical protein